MRSPGIIHVDSVRQSAVSRGLGDGRWVPARPGGYPSFINRIKAAWLVFTGRADALTWTGQ